MKDWFAKKEAAREIEPAPAKETEPSMEVGPSREFVAPERTRTPDRGMESQIARKEKPGGRAQAGKAWEKINEAEREKELVSRVKEHYGRREEEVITPTGKIIEVGVGPSKAPKATHAAGKGGFAAAGEAKGKTYTVKTGDNLTTIAENLYGDKKYWKRIYVANQAKLNGKAASLRPGMELVIPEREAVLSAAAEPISPQTRPDFYTVKNTDTLSKIATRFYSDPGKWRSIYKANTDRIKNPDLLVAGLQIRLPEDKR